MTPQQLFSEAWRNLVTGTTRALIGLIAVAAITGAALVLHVGEARSIFHAQNAYLASGAATIVVNSTNKVDANRCLALGDIEGINGALALRSVPERFKLDTLPATSPGLYEVAGMPLRFFGGVGQESGGVLLSSQLAGQIKAQAGDIVSVAGNEALIAGIFDYPDDGRAGLLASSAIAPVPATGMFDVCLFTVWPADPSLEGLAQSVAEPDDMATPPEISRLNGTLGPAHSTRALLDARTTTYFLYGAAGITFALGFILIRSRKLEFATAQHLGQTKTSQVTQIGLETLMWVVPAALLAISATAIAIIRDVTANEARMMVTEIIAHGLGISAFAVVGALIAATTLTAKKMQAWSKDR